MATRTRAKKAKSPGAAEPPPAEEVEEREVEEEVAEDEDEDVDFDPGQASRIPSSEPHKPPRRAHWPRVRESYLSTTAVPNSTWNLSFLLLAIWIGNTVFHEWYSTGKLVDLSLLWYQLSDIYVPILANLSFGLFSFVFFFLVKLVAWGVLGYGPVLYTLYSLCQTVLVLGPWTLLMLWLTDATPIAGLAISMQVAVIVMKSHSYFFTMRSFFEQARGIRKFDRDTDIVLPRGQGFKDMVQLKAFVYFLICPSLCYYSDFPHIHRRPLERVKKIAFFAMQAATAFFFAYVILNKNLVAVWHHNLATRPLYTVVATCVPGGTFWLLMFFGIFHALLNMWSEVIDYGDRAFYGAWWDCENFDTWWRAWNSTVTNWFRRHIYFQSMQDAGFSQTLALIIVMATSAIWHEYVLYMAFRVRRPWLSSTMMVQVALIFITRHRWFTYTKAGNFLIWFAFFFGYPLVLAAYAWSWCSANPTRCVGFD